MIDAAAIGTGARKAGAGRMLVGIGIVRAPRCGAAAAACRIAASHCARLLGHPCIRVIAFVGRIVTGSTSGLVVITATAGNADGTTRAGVGRLGSGVVGVSVLPVDTGADATATGIGMIGGTVVGSHPRGGGQTGGIAVAKPKRDAVHRDCGDAIGVRRRIPHGADPWCVIVTRAINHGAIRSDHRAHIAGGVSNIGNLRR